MSDKELADKERSYRSQIKRLQEMDASTATDQLLTEFIEYDKPDNYRRKIKDYEVTLNLVAVNTK